MINRKRKFVLIPFTCHNNRLFHIVLEGKKQRVLKDYICELIQKLTTGKPKINNILVDRMR